MNRKGRDGPVAALILAAGYSKRIGRPKALLPMEGATCIERVIRAAHRSGADPIHVVVGHRGSAIAAAIRGTGARAVWNDRYPEGQLSSLRAGLRSLPDRLAAILPFPVDYPLVSAATPRRLIRAFREDTSGKGIFLPTHHGRRGHPYLVDASLAAEYLALGPGETGRTVVRADPDRVLEVPVDDPWILSDLDRPGDYVRMVAALRGASPDGP